MEHHLYPQISQLFHQHRSELVLDAVIKDLVAGGDDGGGFAGEGKKFQQRFSAGGLLRLFQLLFLDHQRDDTHPRQLVARTDHRIGVAGGDHQFTHRVYRHQPVHIHPEEAGAVCFQLDLALFYRGGHHVLVAAQSQQPVGALVFMEHPLRLFPDVEPVLAHGEEQGNVFLGDHVSFAEGGVLGDAGDDAGQVMAQHMAHGLFGGDTFHSGRPPVNENGSAA